MIRGGSLRGRRTRYRRHGRAWPWNGGTFRVETAHSISYGDTGKALGSSGAYLVGSRQSIRYLMHHKPGLHVTDGADAGFPAAAVAARCRIVEREPERRRRLWANRERLFTGFHNWDLRLSPTVSPIMPILIGHAETALRLPNSCSRTVCIAPAIRPPTVPAATSRIRVTVTSEHSRGTHRPGSHRISTSGQSAGLI